MVLTTSVIPWVSFRFGKNISLHNKHSAITHIRLHAIPNGNDVKQILGGTNGTGIESCKTHLFHSEKSTSCE